MHYGAPRIQSRLSPEMESEAGHSKIQTKGKQQYRQNGSEERLVIKRGNRPKASKKHCSTDVNKTKEVRKIAKSIASNLDVTLENVQKLVDSIQDQFDSSSKVMSTLQGITNKHVEKYTCLFSDSNTSGSQEGSNGNRKRLIYPAENATKNNSMSA